MEKISIVVPTYGRFVPFMKLINSIKESDIPTDNYEIIVVSSDPVDCEKINWIENQKKYIDISVNIEADRKTVRNRSLYYYENIGIKKAKYDWVLVCNDDMWFDYNWYNNFMLIKNNSKVYIIASHIGEIRLGVRVPSIGTITKDGVEEIMWLYDMTIIHKSIYEKINYLDENIAWYGKGADLCLQVAFLTDEKPFICENVIVNHDIEIEHRQENISTTPNGDDFLYIRFKWDRWIYQNNKNYQYNWV
jgi:hypothetical protein